MNAIALESAICLAKWQKKIADIGRGGYPTGNYTQNPTVLQNTASIRSNRQHPLNGYPVEFIEQIKKQPYAYENFTNLLSLSKLPHTRLEDTYNKTIQLRTTLSKFSIIQAEIITEIYNKNGRRRMRYAQDAYINSINSAVVGIKFDLTDPNNIPIFSSPSGWGFKSFGEQTHSHQDLPYGNMPSNIAQLILERINCFVDFFEKFDKLDLKKLDKLGNPLPLQELVKNQHPELNGLFKDNGSLRLGGKGDKKAKRKTNKKGKTKKRRKYKKVKTIKRRK